MSTTMSKLKITPHIRWMIRRDMDEVLQIDAECFQFPWNERDWIDALRHRNNIGMVAEYKEHVVGSMLYEIHANRLHVKNFAVRKDHHRSGIGTAMVNKLKSKLSSQRRNRLMLEVRETNLDAQLFFKAQGFRAVSLLRDFYEETPEDAILFLYRFQESDRG
jgi:ribosomal-protein-alanine N-acetyltransferase